LLRGCAAAVSLGSKAEVKHQEALKCCDHALAVNSNSLDLLMEKLFIFGKLFLTMTTMHKYLRLWILALCLVITPTFCEEVGYVFSDDGDFELPNATVSQANLTDTVNFTTAGSGGSGGSYVSNKKVGELQQIFDQRIESEKVVNDAQDMIAGVSPGDHTIDQVCLIYEKIKNNWSISGDPRGPDYYRFANETLRQGKKANRIGAGDCDDFALLMASMVESIGGSTRVMLAYSPSGSHAYAEVYIGTKGADNTNKLKKWLMLKYGVRELSTHWDKETNDVWLNLDWGKKPAVAAYPGSSFYDATEHIPIYIKNDTERYPLNPSPMALFTRPLQANADEPVVFNASESLAVAGIDDFEWDFGEGKRKIRGPEFNVSNIYAKNGIYNVTLKVRDDQGAENSSTSAIYVNNPPIAEFTVSPERPKLGELITFDSSPSNDSDGQIVERYWNLDNKVNSREETIEKRYSKSGLYWVNLTVIDDKGARRTKNLHLRVNEPPVANFVPDREEVNVGENIIFDATSSKDPDDGTLVNYTWDFGDESPAENKIKVKHAFTSGGEKTVTLVVKDNDAAESDLFSCQIKVNNPPLAAFTYQRKEGNKIEFDATSSKDEGGNIVNYKWDFDDYYGIMEAKKSKMVHDYDDPGQYNVTLTVTDDKGSIGTSSQLINLESAPQEPATVVETIVEPTNHAPIAEFSYTVNDLSVSFDATASRDPDGGISRYRMDFGDGGYLEIAEGSAINNMVHDYPTAGQYYVTLTVADDEGLTGGLSQTIDLKPPEPAQPVVVAENVTPEMAYVIHSSGRLEIGQMQTVDLDEGTVGEGGSDDIFFHAVSQSKRYIEPYWSGARIIYTSDVSKLGECASYASTSLGKISIDQQLTGMYIGVITNKGRCSEILVRGVDDPSTGIISVDYTTLA